MHDHDHGFVLRTKLALLSGASNLNITRISDVTELSTDIVGDVLTRLELDSLAEGTWRGGVRQYRLTPAGLKDAHQALGLEPAPPTMPMTSVTHLISEALGLQLAALAQPGQQYLVDIDGTVALRDEDAPDVRHHYDWDRVEEDLPNIPVISIVQAIDAAGHRIIYVTGRSSLCRVATRDWLAAHVGVPGEALLMRTVGDRRADTIVKKELYEKFVKGPVTAVLEDRTSVVQMWRALGLTVLQCADGDF
ncbi:phosphatase domain-containing protein [Actinomadura litoris]|uniref:phosphatase domain-containing protein n=1 Tax=Actinomadura litoris TaxID=2678616 RepID=UPI001FA6E982|nr:hypothetical protein [Actinomadura litoris]